MALTQNSKILASDVSGAIKSITRDGTTFTYTTLGGTTGTFTQQDNNTTYSAGTGISISGTSISNAGVTSVNGSTGDVTISTGGGTAIAVSNVAVAKSGVYYGCTKGSNNGAVLPAGGTWRVLLTSVSPFDIKQVAGNTTVALGLKDNDSYTHSCCMIAVRIA